MTNDPVSPERYEQLAEFEEALRGLMKKYAIPRVVADIKIGEGVQGELIIGSHLSIVEEVDLIRVGDDFIRAAQRLLNSGVRTKDEGLRAKYGEFPAH